MEIRNNPAKRVRGKNPAVNRKSQITKKKPTKRLVNRRVKNLKAPKGVFPNPTAKKAGQKIARFSWRPYGTPENISYAAHPGKNLDFHIHHSERGGFILNVLFPDRGPQQYRFGSIDKAKKAAKGIFDAFVYDENPVKKSMRHRLKKGHVNEAPFTVQYAEREKTLTGFAQGTWKIAGAFSTEKLAKEYAKAFAVKYPDKWVRVIA